VDALAVHIAAIRGRAFPGNHFDSIGRDAIQVATRRAFGWKEIPASGSASRQRWWTRNTPGTPVGIDTAGNVDHTEYVRNRFEKSTASVSTWTDCHDGVVRENNCVNRQRAEDYPYGHFGIVMNNTDPNMHSQNIEIARNEIDGIKFGALLLIGSGQLGSSFL